MRTSFTMLGFHLTEALREFNTFQSLLPDDEGPIEEAEHIETAMIALTEAVSEWERRSRPGPRRRDGTESGSSTAGAPEETK